MDSGFLLSLSLFPVPVIDSSAKRHFFPYFFVKKNIFVDAYLFISCLSSFLSFFLSFFVFLIRISTPLSPCLPPPSSSHPSRLVQVEFSYFFRIYFKDFKADFSPSPSPLVRVFRRFVTAILEDFLRIVLALPRFPCEYIDLCSCYSAFISGSSCQ